MTEMVRVRPAACEDASAITEIYNEAVRNSTASWDLEPPTLRDRQAWLAEKQRSGWPVWVAMPAGGAQPVVGFATFGPFRPKAGYDSTAEHSVYLAPQARGHGVGTALMRVMIDDARVRGLHTLIGCLDAQNLASIAFHQRLGFVQTARLPEVGRKFDRWLDLVFVQLFLQ
jgi:phosphinothricin acetyltransferase